MYKILTATLLIIVSIGLTATFTRMTFNDYQFAKQEVKSYEAALSQADQLGELRDNLIKKYSALSDTDRSRLERLLPRNMDTVRLTIEMTRIAKDNNVNIDSFSFTEKEAGDNSNQNNFANPATAGDSRDPAGNTQINSIQVQSNYSLVDMTLDVSGSYADFKNFVANLEDNLRLTDIQSVSVSNDAEGTNYTVVLRTYWLGT